MQIEPTTPDQNAENQQDNFVTSDKNKRRAVQLDGSILMTQELEAGKRKAVDGAGIVLKVVP